jgi:K+-sensing histidine kinase KdpD
MGSIDSLEKPIDIETRKELISMMRQNILGVSKNITSLLKVAKMDMLQGELALSNVGLKNVLETIAKQAHLLYQSIYTGCDGEVIKRNCKITPLQKSIVINTDEAKLKEVLLIVIENALRHSPKDENLPVVP